MVLSNLTLLNSGIISEDLRQARMSSVSPIKIINESIITFSLTHSETSML